MVEKQPDNMVADDAITGYSLDFLQLSMNQIMAIPDDLLLAGQSINLADNSLNDWDQYKWNKMICRASSLTSLSLSGSMNSLAQMPDVQNSICNTSRTETLALKLESIPGPCDCSVQWMAHVAQQGCPVDLQTDTLQCGSELLQLNLTCPENGVLLYKNDSFTGNSYIAEGRASVESFQPIRSVVVLGNHAWILHLPPESWSQMHKILLPDRYGNLQEAGMLFYILI